MALTELHPDAELAALLTQFANGGGVVDYILFGLSGDDTLGPELHKEAAAAALHIFGRQWPGPYAVEVHKAIGKQVSHAEFVGPFYDYAARKLLPVLSVEPMNAGYAGVFSDPPYGLALFQPHVRKTKQERNNVAWRNQLFADINAALFCDFQCELSICSWSTDWSSYFDVGKEWWGAYLWTVYNPAKNMIIGVGASATD